MQISISSILLLILILTIPIFTLNRKFDLLRKFLFYPKNEKIKLPKLNLSLKVISKIIIYILLALKLYFTLYVLSYIVLNQVAISAIVALILLMVVIVALYVFWNLQSKYQNTIIKILGLSIASIFLTIFSTILIVFIKNSITNIKIDIEFFYILKIFIKNLFISLTISALSFGIAKSISIFLSNINITNKTSKEILYKFFYISNKIPTIVFGFLSYFLFTNLFDVSGFKSEYTIELEEVLFISIISIFYSIIVTDKMINHNFVTPIKILDNRKDNFFSTFINIFFEINITVQFLLLINKLDQKVECKNILFIFINAFKNQNSEIILLITLIYISIYAIYHIISSKHTIQNIDKIN